MQALFCRKMIPACAHGGEKYDIYYTITAQQMQERQMLFYRQDFEHLCAGQLQSLSKYGIIMTES